MSTYDWVTVGTLAMIGVILLVLLLQYFKLQDVWEGLRGCRETLRWARIFESENQELKRALHAERQRSRELQRSLGMVTKNGEAFCVEQPFGEREAR